MNTIIIIGIIVSLIIVLTRTAASKGNGQKENKYVDSFPEGSNRHEETEKDQRNSAKENEMELRACW